MGTEARRWAIGERRVLRKIVLGIGCLCCLGWAAASAEEGVEKALPPEYAGKTIPAGMRDDPTARARGKDMYEGKLNPEINCARCHGRDGKPTQLGKGAPDLSDPAAVQRHSDADWFWRLSEKKPGSKMPGYKDKLSEEERWRLIAYLRTLTQSGK